MRNTATERDTIDNAVRMRVDASDRRGIFAGKINDVVLYEYTVRVGGQGAHRLHGDGNGRDLGGGRAQDIQSFAVQRALDEGQVAKVVLSMKRCDGAGKKMLKTDRPRFVIDR